MKKSELIHLIAQSADISDAAAGRALDATLGHIKAALRLGQNVALPRFGTFHVTERPARKGRNPRTGGVIDIKATRVAKFRPGKSMKDALK